MRYLTQAVHAAAQVITASPGGDEGAASGAEETGALEEVLIAGEVGAGRSGAPQLPGR